MARMRYKPEEIVSLLRQAEVLHSQGMSTGGVFVPGHLIPDLHTISVGFHAIEHTTPTPTNNGRMETSS